MARVLLIGSGPLPGPQAKRTGFPQLRLAHFHRALKAAGHAVRTLLLVPEADRGGLSSPGVGRGGRWEGIFPITEEGPGWIEKARALKAVADPPGRGQRAQAEVIVSAGPYNPARLACLIADDEPVWADLPGDPFAELQAVAIAAAREAEDDPDAPEAARLAERVAAAQGAIWPVLSRADALSVISEAQRYATIGQLGLTGRLTDGVSRERVFVVPIGYDFGLPEQAPRVRQPGTPLGVGLVGGFNTWFDEDTLIEGLEAAIRRHSAVRVVVTGGGIPGHHMAGYARFSTWARRPLFRERIQLRGWLPHGEIAEALRGVHVGLNLDRMGYEAELGSRTRLLFFAHQGVELASTTRSPLASELAAAELLHALPPGDPRALADLLVELALSGSDGRRAARAARYLSSRYDPDTVVAPLLKWVRHPFRLKATPRQETALAEENARLKAELGRVYTSTTWRALSRLHRPLRRRRPMDSEAETS